MFPGRDKAFVFVSGGINFASSEDMGGFYLRLVEILSKRKKDQRSFVNSNNWARHFGFCCFILAGRA